ncbi:MAG: amidohydrolase family protein [Chloroflexi bacterium]|nr:amidohydrolase family protein [Chloroflexota bacterium]
MIIDVHTHIGHSPEDFPSAWMPGGTAIFGYMRATKGRAWEAKRSEWVSRPRKTDDPSGEESYKILNKVGVDKAVLLTLDFTLISEGRYRQGPDFVAARSIEDINRHIADVTKKYSDKYIAFVGVDPRYGRRGLELVRTAVREWGMRGLKLHSCAGWYPNDRELCYPFYELCSKLNIPVLAHCGMELYPLSGKYADPIFFDEVASDFPDLQFCLAHGGGGFSHVPARHQYDVGISLASIHDNVYLDMGSGQAIYARDPVEFYRELRRGLDRVPGKILWGTDNPWLVSTGIDWGGYINLLRNPDQSVLDKAGVSFSKDEIDGIMGENAKHWLNL